MQFARPQLSSALISFATVFGKASKLIFSIFLLITTSWERGSEVKYWAHITSTYYFKWHLDAEFRSFQKSCCWLLTVSHCQRHYKQTLHSVPLHIQSDEILFGVFSCKAANITLVPTASTSATHFCLLFASFFCFWKMIFAQSSHIAWHPSVEQAVTAVTLLVTFAMNLSHHIDRHD